MTPAESGRAAISVEQEGDRAMENAAAGAAVTAADGLKDQRE
jgi:hypothetical protein